MATNTLVLNQQTNPRPVWVYFVSRDSSDGELSTTCHLWSVKPVRYRHAHRVWWASATLCDRDLLGEYDVSVIEQWFRVAPGTDRELVRAEQWAPAAESTGGS